MKKILKELEGKTILRAKIMKLDDLDSFGDIPDDITLLELNMSDGSVFNIIADYGDFTGGSLGEYPRLIRIEKK